MLDFKTPYRRPSDKKKGLVYRYRQPGPYRYLLLCLLVLTAWCFQAAAAEHLLVGGDENYPPYEFLDETGNPSGFNVDMMRAVARVMGLSIRIELGPWNRVRKELEEGRIHAISGMYHSRERERLVDFTSPHIIVTYAVFAGKESPVNSLEDLRGHTVAVQKGDYGDDWLSSRGRASRIIRAEDPGDALRKVSTGVADCALLPRLIGLDQVRRLGLEGIVARGEPVLPRNYCFAVKKGDDRLVAALNEGLTIVRNSGEYDRIYRRWFGGVERRGAVAKTVFIYAGTIVLALLAVLALALGWSWSLKSQVRRKTEALSRELTQRRETEFALRESKDKFQQLFNLESDAIFLIEKDSGDILEVNDSACNMYGFEKARLLSMKNTDLSAEPNRTRDATRDKFSAIPVRYHKKKDGTVFPVEITASHFVFNGKEVHLAAIRDISARVRQEEEHTRLEAQLRQATRLEALGTLAGGIAHDFNNILAVISGNAELAAGERKENEAKSEYIDEILYASGRARELIREILLFSRRMEPVLKAMDLNEVVAKVVKILARTLPKMVRIETRPAVELSAINGDPAQIEQVLMNLATNANDAMPDGGTLNFETVEMSMGDDCELKTFGLPPGDYVRLSVTDTGAGMDKAVLEHIFDPFFTTKEVGKGTGMGLAKAYGVLKTHGGAIRCESLPGEGTAFHLIFPALTGEDILPVRERETPASSPKGGREFLLLVDDDAAILNMGKKILERAGYRVATAATGEETLRIYTETPEAIDLVLMDVSMPGMGGQRCLDALLAIDANARVVILSGYALDANISKMLKAGALCYIAKPFLTRELLEEVRRALDGDECVREEFR